MTHTKGPWRNENGDIVGQHTEFSDLRIASVNYGHPLQGGNAHLIAAAPDLYAALQSLLDAQDKPTTAGDYYAARDTARAALAKARGE